MKDMSLSELAHWSQFIRRAILVVSLPLLVITYAQAQVTAPITSSGLNTQVNLSSNPPAGKIQYDITGGTRPGNGPNLFHSFGDFNVPTNNIANFFNDSGLTTSNILGRVTNGNPSSIFGTIQTTGFVGANLFLMNPSGIVFGPNASLNVGGSVNFTTANYIRLVEGVNSANFYANPASDLLADSILALPPLPNFGFMNASPAAYGFLDGNAASITIQGGNLEVSSGNTLSFVGGPTPVVLPGGNPLPSGVGMTGGALAAPNGLIYMATATSPGEVSLPALSGAQVGNPAPPSAADAVIRIRGGEFVMDHVFLTASNTTDTNLSPIDINIQGTMTLRNASSISSETSSTGHGSNIQVTARSLELDGSSMISRATGDGPGGGISITGGSISLSNGAQIVSSTGGAGVGGDITLTAVDTVSISGFDTSGTLAGVTSVLILNQNTGIPAVASGVYSMTSSSGNGGHIRISAPAGTVTLQNGGTVATIASGDGTGGNITVESMTMDVAEGGQIATFTGADLALGELTGGAGVGGNVTVSAQESLIIRGYSADLALSSSISTQTFGAGKGGDIAISGLTINLESGGQLIANSFTGEAPTGNISVSAPNNLLISGSNPFGFSRIHTDTGSISMAAGSVTLTDPAFVSSGGNIDFQVQNDLNVTAGGSITTSGGAIGINADQVVISGEAPGSRSRIASLASGDAAAGDITLHVRDLRVEDRGLIRSESSGAGQNAGVTVTADSVTVTGLGEISMLNGQGPGGLLEIQASVITLNQGVLSTTASGAGDAGAIKLIASNVSLDSSRISSATNGGTARGGDVTITATDGLTISGLFTDDSGLTSPSGILTRTFASGAAGDAIISAESIQISSGGQINSRSHSSGRAGNVTIKGTASPAQSIRIDGAKTGLFTETSATGTGGDITTWSNQLQLTNGATISSRTTGQMAGAGDAGNILIKADDITISGGATITAASTGPGNAGTVTIQGTNSPALSLLVTGPGSGIFTVTEGTGTGGDIFVNANSVTLQNSGTLSAATSGTASTATGGAIAVEGSQVQLKSAAKITAETSGPADAGHILVLADTFSMSGGATITAQSTGAGAAGTVTIEGTASPAQSIVIDGTGSGIFTTTSGTGVGGSIFLHADSVTLQNGGTLSATSTGTAATATGGAIGITATDSVGLTGGASITVSSTGPADAGNIAIDAGNSFFMQDSSITTQSTQASGGNIDIRAQSVYAMDHSLVSASVLGGAGSGGNIAIDPNAVVLQSSQILAQAVFGQGGNITITTPLFVADSNSRVDASSQFGVNGTVTIQSPTSNLSGSVARLPQTTQQAAALLRSRCLVQAGGEASSFVVAERDTLPAEPGGWMMSGLATASAGAGERGLSGLFDLGRTGTPSHQTDQIDQTDPTPILSLRRMTPAAFLTQMFAVDWTAGCGS